MRRVLFLVDRRNLGNQTATEYAAYRPPGTGRLFPELYGVQKLGPAGLDQSSAIVIATIQRVYSVLTGKELAEEDEDVSAFEQDDEGPKLVAYNPAIPIETFDLIVTDECHRSIYGTWRQVLEYFDAFIVGLTATPSVHTLGFFNRNLVAEYPYERSVVDGVNVGFEVYRIRTRSAKADRRSRRLRPSRCATSSTRAERYETLDADFSLHASATSIAPSSRRTKSARSSKPIATPCSPNSFPAASDVPKTLDLRQGRSPRRGDRAHRPRSLRQRQRLRQEDHLPHRRRRPRTTDPRSSATTSIRASPSPWT